MEDDKRIIPRHVDGRIKVGGFMPIGTFFKVLPLYGITLFVLFSNLTPFMLFLSMMVIGGITFVFSEFKNKETGMQMLKEFLRYQKEGDIHFERSCIIRDEIDRFTRNEIKKGK